VYLGKLGFICPAFMSLSLAERAGGGTSDGRSISRSNQRCSDMPKREVAAFGLQCVFSMTIPTKVVGCYIKY